MGLVGAMWWRLVLTCLLVSGTHGLAPIKWMKLPSEKFVLTLAGSPSEPLAPTQKLTIRDQIGRVLPDVAYFTVRPDKTIMLDATSPMRWCVEASGDQAGDAVYLNHCTSGLAQKWNWVPKEDGQSMIQLDETSRCLAVAEEGVLNGAALELRECGGEDADTKSWAFDGPIPLSAREPVQHILVASFLRHAMISGFVLAMFGAISLSIFLYGRHNASHALVKRRGGTHSNMDDGGVSLSLPLASNRLPIGHINMMAGGRKGQKKNRAQNKPSGGFGAPKAPKQKPRGGDGGRFGSMVKDTFRYSGTVRPGKQSPRRLVPLDIPRPDYAVDGKPKDKGPLFPWQVEVKSKQDIEGMRVAGRIAREVLDAAGRAVAVGVTTEEIDKIVHEETISRGAYPSPLNYQRFPKSCCTSVNEVICHGIPDSSTLKDGDIINVDITVFYGGYHGDCSEMFLVGNVDESGKKLVKVTYDAWQAAIAYCKPGKPFKGIGATIEDYIKPHGYSSCVQFCGHGIGKVFHTTPNIVHARNMEPGKMQVGNTFTIEPMICEGTSEEITWNDGWTATTTDGKRSAQFEHTLLVTENGVEALTGRLPDSNKFWWDD